MASSAPAAAPSRTAARMGAKPVRNLCACAAQNVLMRQPVPHRKPTDHRLQRKALLLLTVVFNYKQSTREHARRRAASACSTCELTMVRSRSLHTPDLNMPGPHSIGARHLRAGNVALPELIHHETKP